MDTIKLTRKDFDASLRYIRNGGILDAEGSVEIEANLGYVSFQKITSKGHIVAHAGTGIEAGEGIEAGSGIEAGWGIEEMEVRCGKKEGGEVVHGKLIETGLPKDVASLSGKKVTVTVGDKTYTATID